MDEEKIKNLKRQYGIVGRSEVLDHALNIALQVAPTDLSVLVTPSKMEVEPNAKDARDGIIMNVHYINAPETVSFPALLWLPRCILDNYGVIP